MENEKTYKAAVGIRGDCLYCPLSLSVDSYFNCLVDCHHCYLRKLNRTWGMDLRPTDPEAVYKKLRNGIHNKNPSSSLSYALKLKKTIRVGNKTDPYQPVEMVLKVTRRILKALIKLRWTFVIQTRFVDNLLRDEDLLSRAHQLGLLNIMPVISPGAEGDRELLERKRTPPIGKRLEIISNWIKKGYNVGVNGEPFIPGFNTIEQFRDIIKRLKSIGVKSYNTYNLHFNDYVAKRFNLIGLDIKKIWIMNQDNQWKIIQKLLCKIADEENIILGCPDFVNTGKNWFEKANTCCGITVDNPSHFTTHQWKKGLQNGLTPEEVIKTTWEGILIWYRQI